MCVSSAYISLLGDCLMTNRISCKCGTCRLTLNDPVPRYSVLCACQDCRQALRWAAKFGGQAPSDLVRLTYFRSDFLKIEGKEHIIANKLRGDSRSTRLFCNKCYSCIGIDHDAYQNNVLLTFIDHCVLDLDFPFKPKAVLFAQDYPSGSVPVPSDEIPVFHSLQYPQERARLRATDPIGKTLAPPKTPAKGTTIRDLIACLPVENLNLEPGLLP
jgi:hypothetical protein